MMNANSQTLAYWAAVRTRIVEAGTHDEIGIPEVATTDNERFRVVSSGRHRMKLCNLARDNLASTVTQRRP